MNFEDFNFKVVASLGSGNEEMSQAFRGADDLLLFMGTGGGVAPPGGGPLPEVNRWSILAVADSQEDAEKKVKAVLDQLGYGFVISSHSLDSALTEDDRDAVARLDHPADIEEEIADHRAFVERRKNVGDPDQAAKIVRQHEELIELLEARLAEVKAGE